MVEELTPRQIVEQLDKYIIRQDEAKRAVAVALRNRYRRRRLTGSIKDEIIPKNILMIGPTGVGKTEIARRVSRLVRAPFLKVEVTKFTEVGYVGRDVESMIRDLVDSAIHTVQQEKMDEVESEAEKQAFERLLDTIAPRPGRKGRGINPFQAMFGSTEEDEAQAETTEDRKESLSRRMEAREKLKRGELDDEMIEIEVDSQVSPMVEIFSGAGVEEMGINFQDLLGGMMPKKKKKRRVTVEEARNILKAQEAEKLVDMDDVKNTAVKRVEESGIIFLDEIDKITGRHEGGQGPEVSREGVQRDILPIVEGSTVMTKHGPVNTEHILFISAGAFHLSRPSDLIPELQGRFPIRVELQNLDREAFQKILTLPENALLKQYRALLSTEGIDLEFTDEAVSRIAEFAYMVNEQTENIGARRLHTILEQLLEDLSFEAPDLDRDHVVIDRDFVEKTLEHIVSDEDLSKYIL